MVVVSIWFKKTFELRYESGPFSFPSVNSRPPNQITEMLKNKVIEFYKHPNNNRIINSGRDLVRFKEDRILDFKSKQRLLMTLEALYKEFIKSSDFIKLREKISVTTFYLLKPCECIYIKKQVTKTNMLLCNS